MLRKAKVVFRSKTPKPISRVERGGRLGPRTRDNLKPRTRPSLRATKSGAGPALALRPLERRFLDKYALALVAFSGPADAHHDDRFHRCISSPDASAPHRPRRGTPGPPDPRNPYTVVPSRPASGARLFRARFCTGRIRSRAGSRRPHVPVAGSGFLPASGAALRSDRARRNEHGKLVRHRHPPRRRLKLDLAFARSANKPD
jgi:hypothetical protein